jgi:hypothetical protein
VSHGNASRRSCARPPNDPRARPPWHVSSSAASSFPPRDRGQRQTLPPRPPASIDRILTQVPRLTDVVAGAEFEGDLAFLAGRPSPRRSVTLPRRCEHVPAEPAHARCGRRAGSAGRDSPFGKEQSWCTASTVRWLLRWTRGDSLGRLRGRSTSMGEQRSRPTDRVKSNVRLAAAAA